MGATRLPLLVCIAGGNDLLYFLHVVAERQYDIIGGDAAETIVNEDVEAEQRAVRLHFCSADGDTSQVLSLSFRLHAC